MQANCIMKSILQKPEKFIGPKQMVLLPITKTRASSWSTAS